MTCKPGATHHHADVWCADCVTAFAEERVRDACLSDKKIEFIENLVKQARAEGYEEGKRDSIIEFCEGDRSMLAQYEQKAYQKGRAEALEDAAKVAERADLYAPGGIEPRIAKAIRALLDTPHE